MSVPHYPKYKASGVQWLGDVPEHWGVVQYKQCVEIQNGSDHKHVEQSEGYPVFGSGGIFAYASEFLYDGESVLLGRKGTVDKPLYVNGRFWTVDTMYWTKIRANTLGRYAYYLAVTIPFDYYSTHTALPSMTKGALSSHLVALPPLREQTAIAEFLDRETGKIDALVAEQQRLIELLKEKRQAVISHAVTKGLNPNAPMKPSGIEWLGDVPQHWNVKPLKHLATLQTGATPPTDDSANYTEEEMFQWIRPEDLNETGAPTKASKFLTEKGWALSRRVAAGSSLICCIGTIGRVGITDDVSSTNQQITAAVPRGNGRFLFYAISAGRAELETASTGNVLRILNTERLGKIYFPSPPLCEQTAIAEFLDSESAKFDALTTEARRAIELLQERRTALISAAVTGQIDVRHQN